MKIKGKLCSIVTIRDEENKYINQEAEIEPPSVDTSKIKPGDTVWVEYKVWGDKDAPDDNIHFESKHLRLIDDVVVHFPQPGPATLIRELKYNSDKEVLDDEHRDIVDKINELIRAVNGRK